MKICFLSSMHPPLDKRVFDKEARSLAEAGFEVVHLAPGDIQDQVREGVLLKTYAPPAGLIGRALGLFKLYARANEIDADVYHCNEVDSWMAGIFLKLFKRKKVVFDVHEHYPATFGHERFPRWLQPLCAAVIRLLFRCLTPFTDYLFLAKESVSPDFPNAGDKTEIVYNYTPLRYDRGTTKKDVPFEVREIFKDKFTAVHTGLFSVNRGWPQLLSAMTKITVPDFQFLSIGKINDGTEEEFLQTADRLGLKEKIILRPWLPFEEVYAHLLCAQIGLVLFQPEDLNNVYAFPHKMFDYMLAGLPVIVPEFSVEIAHIVKRHGCGLLIDTSDPDEIAGTINTLGNSCEKRAAMGENGHRAVMEECHWESQAEKLVKYYNGLQSTTAARRFVGQETADVPYGGRSR